MSEDTRSRTARFAGVEHTVTVLDGDGCPPATAVRDAGPGTFHVSLHAADPSARDAAVAALRETGYRGAVDAVVQPPASGTCAAVLWTAGGECRVEYPRSGVSTLAYRGGTMVRVGHGDERADGFTAAFDLLDRGLAGAGLGLRDLWKTWSYLPVSAAGDGGADGFVDFNVRRAEVFGDTAFPIAAHSTAGRAFPANTGVADLCGAASLTALGGRTAGQVRLVGVENRRQRPAYRYGPGTGRPRPAQFSRAVLLAEGGEGLLFMAGTASVVDSHTVGATVEEQLDTTLGITAGLLSDGALAGGGLAVSGGLDALLYLVVYVARPDHLDRVRKLVTARVRMPVLCVLAPLTRDDLLVEVDGLGPVAVRPADGPEGPR